MRQNIFEAGQPAPKPLEVERKENDIMSGWLDSSKKPLVSIVCLAYNHEPFIRDALLAFLSQETTFPYEIIVHDDASSDKTPKIIEEYQRKFPNIIRAVLQKNNHFSNGKSPLPLALEAAKGTYIAYCEADDYWTDSKKLQTQVTFLEDNPKYSVCYSDAVPAEEGLVVSRDFGIVTRDLSSAELQVGPSIATLTACFRNVLNSPPEFNFIKYGDKFMWSLLGLCGPGKYLPEIGPSIYRIHSGGIHSSSSSQVRDLMYLQTFIAMVAYHSRTGNDHLAEYFLRELKAKVYKLDGISKVAVRFMSRLHRILHRLRLL